MFWQDLIWEKVNTLAGNDVGFQWRIWETRTNREIRGPIASLYLFQKNGCLECALKQQIFERASTANHYWIVEHFRISTDFWDRNFIVLTWCLTMFRLAQHFLKLFPCVLLLLSHTVATRRSWKFVFNWESLSWLFFVFEFIVNHNKNVLCPKAMSQKNSKFRADEMLNGSFPHQIIALNGCTHKTHTKNSKILPTFALFRLFLIVFPPKMEMSTHQSKKLILMRSHTQVTMLEMACGTFKKIEIPKKLYFFQIIKKSS